jgi:DNA-binding NtrC family response regulator
MAALRANPIAWVITDLKLPTGDGMDILAYARSHQPQAKVIIMTAFGSEATRQRTLAQGAHAFLSKPFSGEALLTIVTHEPRFEPIRPAPNDDRSEP